MIRRLCCKSIVLSACLCLCIAESHACLNPDCEFDFISKYTPDELAAFQLSSPPIHKSVDANSYCMEIKWIADYSYFAQYGSGVTSKVNSILNKIENIFMNNGISLTIKNEGSVNIYTSYSSDPYSNPSALPCHPSYAQTPTQGCSTVAKVLHKFEQQTNAVTSDAVMLFSSQALSNHGVANTHLLCTGYSRAIGLSHHKTGRYELSETIQAAIMAHELIHIIRADGQHDEQGSSLMSPAGPNNGWTGLNSYDQSVINQHLSSYSCFSCSTASCFDLVQNQGETGVDCGGPCPTACATCFDLVQNQGETGVDCGGPCPNICLPGDCTTADGYYSGTYTGTHDYKAPNYMILPQINNQTTIPIGADIDMSGGSRVTLLPGFKALPGSVYKAYIENCAN